MKQNFAAKLWKRALSTGLSFAMAVTMIPAVGVQAAGNEETEMPTKAGSIAATDDTVTENQPFVANTGGSRYFGSPAFIVRQVKKDADNNKPTEGNGRMTSDLLIAAAEAGYDSAADAGGQDIMVSVSGDAGANWKYSFPFYFADSAENAPGAATVSNPVLIDKETYESASGAEGHVTGGDIYLLANVYPGTATENGINPENGTGFVSITPQGASSASSRLVLTNNVSKTSEKPKTENDEIYTYYVGDFTADGYAPVLSRTEEDTQAAGDEAYYVDQWYNLYTKSGDTYTPKMQKQIGNASQEVQQNIFYKDSDFHVYNAGYIMCVVSRDNGQTWGTPEILNPYVYNSEDETVFLSPGKGLKTSLGRLIVPAYSRTNSGDKTTSKASVIFRCLEAGHNWHRSNEVTLASNEANDPTWAEGNGVVELSNGYLRMFLRNGRENTYYADLSRNDETDMFEVAAPLSSGRTYTPDSKISAVEYSGSVNGERAILTVQPTGGVYGNGRIFVLGKSNEAQNPAALRLMDEYAVGSQTFASANIDEMNYGSNIGLMWDDNSGAVTFQNLQTLDVVQNCYIPNLEYDINLTLGDTPYHREYTISGLSHVQATTPQDPSGVVEVDFDKGETTVRTVPALYSIKSSYNPEDKTGSTWNERSLTYVYNAKPDETADIEFAEFTFNNVSNIEGNKNMYSIYSEKAKRYYTNYNGVDKLFTTTRRNNVQVTYSEAQAGFELRTLDKDVSGNNPNDRRLAWGVNQTFNVNWGNNSPRERFQLLEKRDEGDTEDTETDLIPGYKKVTEITSGKKYLVAYENAAETGENDTFKEKSVAVLYPANGRRNSSKIVYKTRQAEIAAVKSLTFTPVKTGTVNITVNDITYHITVREDRILLPKGGSKFIKTSEPVTGDIVSSNPNVVTGEKAQEQEKALFHHNASGDGYSDVPDWNIDMSGAEFEITKNGDVADSFFVYSRSQKVYLENSAGASVFQPNKAAQDLIKVDGADSFKVKKTGASRYLIFFYGDAAKAGMNFNSMSAEDSDTTKYDYHLEFLRKKSSQSNLDPIPGYERVSEIEEGTYLITEFHEDAAGQESIYVLYPNNGQNDQSKKFQSVAVDGIRFTAAQNANVGDTANVTAGGVTYKIEIGGTCNHSLYPEITTEAVEPTCKKKGSTGTTRCSNCQTILEEAKPIDELVHTWPTDWEVTDPVINRAQKTVTDGTRSRTCSGKEETETEPISGEEYLESLIGQTIADANAEIKKGGYAAETIKALEDAIKAATEAVSGQTPANVAGKIDALVGLETALDPDNMISQGDYNGRKEQLDGLVLDAEEELKKTEVYTEASLGDLQDALDAIGEMKDADGNISYADMETAIENLTNALGGLKTLEEEKCEELLPELKDTLASLDAIAAAGQQDYTDATWKKFIEAYNKLTGKTDEELKEMGFETLNGLLADLKTKLEKKKIITSEKKLALKDYTIGNVVYTVTDAVKNEVVLKKGANIKKFTVPATQTIDGISCKVVGIGDEAFKNCGKLKNVIIGENVTSIGAKAFFKCKKLNKVTINGASAPVIKKAAFKKTASKVTVKAKKLNKKQKKAFLKKLKKTGKIGKKSVVK